MANTNHGFIYLGAKDSNNKCYHACCCLKLSITSISNYGQVIHA
jgi:hypothetical protein